VKCLLSFTWVESCVELVSVPSSRARAKPAWKTHGFLASLPGALVGTQTIGFCPFFLFFAVAYYPHSVHSDLQYRPHNWIYSGFPIYSDIRMNRKQCLVVDHWETSPATILCSKTKFIGHKWKKISRNQSQNWLLFCCQLGSRLVSLLLGLKNCVFITLGVLTYMTWHISYRRAWVGGQRHCSSVRQVSSSFFITNSNNSRCKHSLNRWRKISQSGRSEKMNYSLHIMGIF